MDTCLCFCTGIYVCYFIFYFCVYRLVVRTLVKSNGCENTGQIKFTYSGTPSDCMRRKMSQSEAKLNLMGIQNPN